MKIEVNFTTQLRHALGRSSESITLAESTTARQLIEALAGDHPEVFSTYVLAADGELLPNIIVCVGDQQVSQPAAHILRDGDVVTLLSAISGG